MRIMKKSVFVLLITFSIGLLGSCSSPEEKAADYVENANLLFKEGKIKKAELEYKNALQINQNLVDAWYGIAQIHERRQQWRKSFAVLTKIRELNPRHVNGRIKLGQILLASNQLDKALLDAKEIIELAPDDARSHALMAAVQYRLENYDGAQIEVDKALSIDSINSDAQLVLSRIHISRKDYEQAHEVLDKGMKTNPENVSMYLMKIQAYQETGDQQGIEAVYIMLADKFPRNLAYQHALAKFYSVNKDLDKAETIYSRIVSQNPENVEEKLRLVEFTKQHRSIDQSIKLLKDYIQQNNDEYRYQFALGSLYEQSDRNIEAMAIYQRIIDADGLQLSGLKARNSIALAELRSGNRGKATSLINEVLGHDKNNESALLIQAGLKLADKAYDDAIIDLRTLLRDNPGSVKALNLLARSYEAKGSNELALENYLKAYRINTSIPVSANQLANHYLRNKKFDAADEVLEDSIARGNRSLNALKLFAQVKLSLQDWESAEKVANLLEKIEGQESLSQQVLGIVYQGKQLEQESIEAFKKAHELSPSSRQPIVALVQTFFRGGKLEDARKFLNSVLTVDANNLTAYTMLGQLSLYEKHPDEAEKYFLKTVEINPKQAIGYRRLARIYETNNRPDMAEKIILDGLVAMPDNAGLAISLASHYENQQAFDKAIGIYENLLEKNPDVIIAKNNLASLLTDHRTDKASLDKAREIASKFRNSKIPHFRDTYAWTQINSDLQLEQAINILEGVVKEVGETPIFHYHLGEAYLKQGNKLKAAEYLGNAIKYSKAGTELSDKANQSLKQISQ